jgi:hypothetical protein
MKRKAAPFIYGLIFIALASQVLSSCVSAKKGCGCGTDINRNYGPKRFH